MMCTLDGQYCCGQEQVGRVTLLTPDGLLQERPCLHHVNEMMNWIECEGPVVGLSTWRAEVDIADAREQL